MHKVLIVFGSTTGNTESIASAIAEILENQGVRVEIKNASEISDCKNLVSGYDAVLMGCSCWGDTDIELQDDFAPLVDQFSSMGLSRTKVAAFASGDSSYVHFCGAVDVIENAAKKCGANIITDGLRVEGDASTAPEEIQAFAEAIVQDL